MKVQPLTRCNSDGEPYQRSATVTRQIEVASLLSPAHLIERACISDPDDPDYIQEETLVYLIRDSFKQKQTDVLEKLSEILLDRCTKFIRAKLASLGPGMVDDALSDVIEKVFQRILDLESNRGDYFQVKFWHGLRMQVISAYRDYRKLQDEAKDIISLSDLDKSDSDRKAQRRITVSSNDLLVPPLSVEQKLLYKEGLNLLKEPLRTAFVLYHYEGWQIDSKDPNKHTIRKYFDKTERTIRNWLKEADKQLNQWRGDNDLS